MELLDRCEGGGRAFWIPAAAQVLKSLCRSGRTTAAELSELGFSKGTLYRALARLRDLGLIEADDRAHRSRAGRGGKPAATWRLRPT